MCLEARAPCVYMYINIYIYVYVIDHFLLTCFPYQTPPLLLFLSTCSHCDLSQSSFRVPFSVVFPILPSTPLTLHAYIVYVLKVKLI